MVKVDKVYRFPSFEITTCADGEVREHPNSSAFVFFRRSRKYAARALIDLRKFKRSLSTGGAA